ncbi:2359_t:CDS:2 [Entrophospora sp. SA101]|nr:10573_t:CDS:2 [Entrophospora sp. SA101]CAJ0905081.1 2359_t:CDS:2 [Entrophospora sp. SA101]
MPTNGTGVERVGVQFGSLSLSETSEEQVEMVENDLSSLAHQDELSNSSTVVETQQSQSPPPQQQSQQPLNHHQITLPAQQQQQQTHQQQLQAVQIQLQQQTSNQQQQQTTQVQTQSSNSLSQPTSINRLPTSSSSTSSTQQQQPSSINSSAPSSVPTNASYLKQQQEQSAATAYLNQHHLGGIEPISAPYTSYINQPPNQLSQFGIGPIQPDYATLYPAEAQRGVMGYYADPSYPQASPVTSSVGGFQGRDKYSQETTSNSSSTQSATSGASPYGYPTTPTTPSTPHYSNTGYDEVSPPIHHLPGAVPNVHDYQKTYGGGSGMPPINFLGNAGGVNSNPQPSSASGGSNTTTSSKTGNNNSDLNPQGQYKSYQDKTSASGQQQSSGVGQSGAIQHQQQSNTPNYYSQQQAQQVFNSYQYPQNHQYHPHQAHHQGAGNRSQYWNQN